MAALSGMKEICRYMNRSESTMLILIRDTDFPARKILGCWESDTELADDWRKRQILGLGLDEKSKTKTDNTKRKRKTPEPAMVPSPAENTQIANI